MVALTYVLPVPGVVEVHRAGCAAVTGQRTRYESPPTPFEADTEAAVHELFGADGCLDPVDCPHLDLTVQPCAIAVLTRRSVGPMQAGRP